MGNYNSRRLNSRLEPMTDRQGDLMVAIDEYDCVVVTGPAGTGKTYVTASKAAEMYADRDIQKIVITRAHEPVGRDIGFLPGDLAEKTEPWALPVLSVLEEKLGGGIIKCDMKETKKRPANIEVVPLAMIRGRSFDNTFMIVDEAQNLTLHELKALLTRQGKWSKLVLNGDISQVDNGATGLSELTRIIRHHRLPVPIVNFTIEDVVRSGITKMWLETFYKEGI
mgnify:FL=1